VGEAPLVLAVDVGSTSVRASVYDARARPVPDSLVRRPSAIRLDRAGAAEADPEALARLVEEVVDEALRRQGSRAGRIAAVGLDTLTFTACGVDGRGAPLTPLYTYADARSSDDVAALRHELDGPAVYQRTGCPLHTSYMPARLRWFARTQPAAAGAVRRWLDFGTFLHGRWLGRRDAPVSYSVASWSGLLDRARLAWDEGLLRHLDVPEEALPQLADYSDAQRGLSPDFATRWPTLRETPFFLAVGDGASANVGSGCVSAHQVALTVGTTGAMRVVIPDRVPPVPPGLWAYKVGASETLLGGAFSEGGNVFAWAVETLRLPPKDGLEAALRSLAPDGHGLTVLPFISGERSPGWSSNARAAIAGLTASTTGAEVLQALLEAVCYRFALVARLLRGHVDPDHEIVASGGAMSRSPYWAQLMADVIGHRVRLSRETELTSRGTAILALRALGVWGGLDDERLEAAAVHEPDPTRVAVYQAALERQHRLYDALIGHEAEIGASLSAALRPE
jgi:gluconokinase